MIIIKNFSQPIENRDDLINRSIRVAKLQSGVKINEKRSKSGQKSGQKVT